jgi:general L-amino acid transport system substrate-binding protein
LSKSLPRSARPLFAAGLMLAATVASAGPVVDRIRAEGVIRCGGVSRPGLVGQSAPARTAAGLYLDVCRAVGAALIGPDGRMEFRPYDSDAAFRRVADGADDLSFLTGSEILDHHLVGSVALGPPVVFVSTAVMVAASSRVQRLGDLAGKSVCFYQGSNAHQNLEAAMAARKLDFVRMGYMEYGEIDDAYDAGVCEAKVGEASDLAAARLGSAGSALKSRILDEPLATFPVLAVSPMNDAEWSAIVAWAIFTLQRAELPAAPWRASGVGSLPIDGQTLGLSADWQARVVGAAGTYADIFAKNLGDGSRLKFPRGPNAPVEAGGRFVTPFRE